MSAPGWTQARPRAALAVVAAVIAATALVLWATGHPLICTCGHVRLWQGETFSPETSQQLLDWYTPSHLLHGILFYAALRLALPRWSWGSRLVVAALIEAGWELLENAPIIIDRYRAVTASLHYFGDSVLNSVSDLTAMVLGFTLARVLPVWASVALVIGFELLTTALVRDGLTLNVLMLVWPLEVVRVWQGG